jgi:hypothetical protein
MRRMTAGGPTRRALLTGGSVLMVSACRPGEQRVTPSLAAREIRRRAGLAAESVALRERYAGALARLGPGDGRRAADTRELLISLAAEHDAHAAALLPPAAARWLRRTESTPASSLTPASPSLAAPSSSAADRGGLALERKVLAAAERAAYRRRAQQARTAAPDLARLLASIAACNAAHAALLDPS